MKKFLRRSWDRYSRLGKRRKKKQVWRRPTGRDNKMRERRKGYPPRVSIGYKKGKKFNAEKLVIVSNLRDLEKVGKKEKAVIAHIGKRKKIEIIKNAKKKKISVQNINIDKFLKKLEEKDKK